MNSKDSSDEDETYIATVEEPEDDSKVVITLKRSDAKRLIALIEKLLATI